ncbi:MAG TPA: hypothetical protein VF411_14260 [Bacteroidia bacterium]
MKNYKWLLPLVCLLTSNLSAEMDTVSIETALKGNRIKLEIKGVGGYQGRCIKMKIKNLQFVSLSITIEAGRRLDSKDSNEQDILVIKDTMLVLLASQEKTFSVVGYCCQAHNHAPKPKSDFTIGSLEKGTLYNLARYINRTPLPNDVIQYAIWVVSDNINPAAIRDDGSAAIQGLRRFISFEKKITFTWYSISYKKVKDKVFSGIPEILSGIIDYHTSDYSHITLAIKDSLGNVVDKFDAGQAIGRGDYTYNLNWNIYKLPNQTYTIIVYQNGEEIKRKPVTLNETAF